MKFHTAESPTGRLLQVPTAEERRHHRETYARVEHLCPVKWEPEQIQRRIREALRGNAEMMALRTDLQNCFGTIPQDRVKSRIEALSLPASTRQALFDVLRSVSHGVPIGSPLSPWLAELVLRDIDAAMTDYPNYFRYVDDICVLGSLDTCAAAKHRLETILHPLGMRLSPQKTRILPAKELMFLGRSYQTLDDSRLIEVDLSGETFRLPNHKTVKLRVNKTGQPYQDQGGRITYSLSCLLNRMSQQPTPYILEMLMLRPACEDESLHRIIQHPELIFDRGLPYALHGKIYRYYLTQVKARAKPGCALPIGAAGEVFRWLRLTNHIMRHALLLDDYREVEAEWLQLLESLEAGHYEPYHRRIKQLFKQEYDLRARLNEGEPQLPAEKPAFVAFSLD
ncbi:MAG: hypothetical protein ABS95_01675 [Verrucomicrobia bacterium SCN 57-15]|nr:MAG: hypothetical protein ABS95_01675 [Verrucomicrobia bacterium SCN 57-15]